MLTRAELYDVDESAGTRSSFRVIISKEFTASSTSNIDTGIYNYDFLSDYEMAQHSSWTKTALSHDWTIRLGSEHPYQIYLVTDNSTGTNYYYFDVTDIDNSTHSSADGSFSIVAYEYNSSGELVSSYQYKR